MFQNSSDLFETVVSWWLWLLKASDYQFITHLASNLMWTEHGRSTMEEVDHNDSPLQGIISSLDTVITI